MKIKDLIKPALILFLICLITASALVGTNILTSKKIEQENIENAEKIRLEVLPDAYSFEDMGDYVEGIDYYGKVIGYVFTTGAKGYSGTVKVMTGVSSSGTISGVAILEHNETVGLGANTAKKEFLSQYNQKIPQNGFSVTKTSPADGEISAVTGATISSKAVTKAVNEAVDMYKNIKGGE